MKKALILSVIFALFSCSKNPTAPKIDYQPQLDVLAILNPRCSPQRFLITHTFRITDYIPFENDTINSVPGLDVWVKGRDRKFQFLLSMGYYNGYDFWPNPGEHYHLSVCDSLENRVEGDTQVPGWFKILTPANYDTLERNRSLSLVWNESQGAKQYWVGAYLLLEKGWKLKFYETTLETSLVVCPTDSGKYQLKIFAMDENFWDYYRGYQGGNPNAEYICHLKGGVGVFGSYSIDKIFVEVK